MRLGQSVGDERWTVGEALPGAGPCHPEEVGDAGPGARVVPGVGDGSGQALLGFGHEAGQQVQVGGGVAAGAETSKRADGEDSMAASMTP